MPSLDTAISLTDLDEIKAFLGEDVQKDGLWIYCSQGDATAATVEITDTTIVLIITGGVQAGTNTLTFADADKDSTSSMVVLWLIRLIPPVRSPMVPKVMPACPSGNICSPIFES